MKTCKNCKTEKTLDEFYKHPEMSDGRLNKCKECKKDLAKENRDRKIEYYREYDRKRQRESFKRMFMHRYSQMKTRIEGRDGGHSNSEGKELCSKEEFLAWCARRIDDFRELYKEWQKSGYEQRLAPSVDRIDNDKGYVPENMQWITHSENCSKYTPSNWKNLERNEGGQFAGKR